MVSSLDVGSLYWELMAIWKAEHHHGVVMSTHAQKIVNEKDVQNHLNRGWSVKTSISPASVIMEKPIDMQKVLLGIKKVIEDAKQATLSE